MKTIRVKSWLDRPSNFSGIVIEEDNDKFWYQNGLFHRADGPAIEWSNGTKMWYQNGQLHRLDGPAIASGEKRYFVLDRELTENQFQVFQYMWGTTLLEKTDELMRIFVKLVLVK